MKMRTRRGGCGSTAKVRAPATTTWPSSSRTIPDPDLADRLDRAIQGKGAFGRFKNHLARHPTAFARWISFSAEHQRGRARQWLAANGYRPNPS